MLIAGDACSTHRCISISSLTIWIPPLFSSEPVECFFLPSWHLSLSAGLRGAYHVPLLELHGNPRPFGEMQLGSITKRLGFLSIQNLFAFHESSWRFLLPFLLFLLLGHPSSSSQNVYIIFLKKVCMPHSTPLMGRNWNICDETALNIGTHSQLILTL